MQGTVQVVKQRKKIKSSRNDINNNMTYNNKKIYDLSDKQQNIIVCI